MRCAGLLDTVGMTRAHIADRRTPAREVLDRAASELREAGIDATALTLNIRDERAVEALLEEPGARG